MSEPITAVEKSGFVTIRAVIFADPEMDGWIAQGLDYDICAQAETLEDVHVAFEKAVMATACVALDLGKEPFEDVEKAPQRFWDMFEGARKPPLRRARPVPVPGQVPVKVIERLADAA
jgi:hypothetical protein